MSDHHDLSVMQTPKAAVAEEMAVHDAEKQSSAGSSSAATSATEPVRNSTSQRDQVPSKQQQQLLPEATQQPILETIAPPGVASHSSKSSNVPIAPRQNGHLSDLYGSSPRSIRDSDSGYRKSSSSDKLMDSPMVRGSPPRPQDVKTARISSSSSRRHTRTHSDEIPRTIHGGYGVPPAAQLVSPQPPFHQPYYQLDPRLAMSYQGQFGPPPPHLMQYGPPQYHSEPGRTYSETGSYRGSVDDQPQPHLRIAHSFGDSVPSGSESRPLLYQTKSERMTSSKSGRRRSRHRKSHSHNAAIPHQDLGYGSFWTAPPPVPPLGPEEMVGVAAPQSPRVTGKFDRRNELLALAGRINSPRSDMSPKTPLTPKSYPLPPPPDMRVSFSPRTPGRELMSSAGGEAVYLAQKRHKSESSRRKHIRQHSAQLYMEDIKGEPQPPACRDIFFLLLFVFHLFFIILLGNLYGGEALGGDSPTQMVRVSPGVKVTVYYNSLLFLAVVTGAFAVGVSTMILALMSMFAKYFVQVALCVIITLSFAWGTAGIGLSPKNVVPITGIIALALSVAYAFIVWDRIPFAAANLVAALSAIRRHPGTVVVALFFQVFALGWSIYYCIVFIGMYDAIREGKINASHQLEVFIYVLLGFSFYWTYQVLLVRTRRALPSPMLLDQPRPVLFV